MQQFYLMFSVRALCNYFADALFRSRSGEDHEATVLIKTQFMTFWDGLMTEEGCQILIMGATNRPDDVDAAILRRMPSKYYIGLPVRAQQQYSCK